MDAEERMVQDIPLFRSSSGSSAGSDSETLAYELEALSEEAAALASEPMPQRPRWWSGLPRKRGHRRHGSRSSTYLAVYTPRRRRSLYTRVLQLLTLLPYALLIAIITCAVFFPSYTNPPQRYTDLRKRVQTEGSSANVNNEKVFIAASLYDHEGELLSGEWGRAVLYLIDILGHDNVFLSIYENDPDDQAREALEAFRARVRCETALVTEHLDLNQYPRVTTADGRPLLKRIAFLADVRNRALRPLEDSTSSAYTTRFDKLLYINDVIFDPIDAANLLFSTNVDAASGRTTYRAACAVDFINPFKFYDTFATRDLEGFDMGVPFYPWFTNAGKAESRRDVLQQKDAVRVKSCWGGMVAFEAKWFQTQQDQSSSKESPPESTGLTDVQKTATSADTDAASPPAAGLTARAINVSAPLRFRSETDTYWDASECCLIHADLSIMDSASLASGETGIYMNPYIRVAYSSSVRPWLPFTQRFERLYIPVHRIVNWIANRPSFNPRQFHTAGQEVVERVWVWDSKSAEALRAGTVGSLDQLHGQFKQVRRNAQPGGFCGIRKLLFINEHALAGEAKWGADKVPTGYR